MKPLCFLAAFCLVMNLTPNGNAQTGASPRIVRMAKLGIDPAQLDAYKAALAEEIETSVRVEPGVLSLSAVSEKDHPDQVTILEVYADAEAYDAHLKSAHFTKYKTTTRTMVRSLDLVETVPIALAAKRN